MLSAMGGGSDKERKDAEKALLKEAAIARGAAVAQGKLKSLAGMVSQGTKTAADYKAWRDIYAGCAAWAAVPAFATCMSECDAEVAAAGGGAARAARGGGGGGGDSSGR